MGAEAGVWLSSVRFRLKIRANGLHRLFAGAHKRHRTRLKAMGEFSNLYCEQHAGNGFERMWLPLFQRNPMLDSSKGEST